MNSVTSEPGVELDSSVQRQEEVPSPQVQKYEFPAPETMQGKTYEELDILLREMLPHGKIPDPVMDAWRNAREMARGIISNWRK